MGEEEVAKEPHTESAGLVSVFHGRSARLEAQQESSHTEHSISYLAEGWLQVEHGTPIKIGAGAITIVPAGVPHRVLGGKNVDLWVASFCAGCLSLDESQLLMAPFLRVRLGAFPSVALGKTQQRRALRLFRDLEEESGRRDAEAAEMTRSLLQLLLGLVSRAGRQEQLDLPPGSLVSDALAYIQSRCLEPISLRDVAAAVFRSPGHVATAVKGATGHSVGEWITSARVAEAAARLVHTDDDLDTIAAHIGWTDKTHFIRQFKKNYGATPAAWRRQHRRAHVQGGPPG